MSKQEQNQPEYSVIKNGLYLLINIFIKKGNRLLVRGEILDILKQFGLKYEKNKFLEHSLFYELQNAHIGAVTHDYIYLGLRLPANKWKYTKLDINNILYEYISCIDYLNGEELVVNTYFSHYPHFNLGKFRQKREVCLPEQIPPLLLKFLVNYSFGNNDLLVNKRIKSVKGLHNTLKTALTFLKIRENNIHYKKISRTMQGMDLLPGWGRTVLEIKDSIKLLLDILENPDFDKLYKFLSVLPLMSFVVVVAPSIEINDNGIQIKGNSKSLDYILPLVRCLEQEIWSKLYLQGVPLKPKIAVLVRSITDNKHSFTLSGTERTTVIGVSGLKSSNYLDEGWKSWHDFAFQAVNACLQMSGGISPDYILGYGTQGGITASLLAGEFKGKKPLLGLIMPELQKSKHLFSAQYWQSLPQGKQMARVFLAELIAMNRADLIINSSAIESWGDEQIVGQYEMYRNFILPGLLRIEEGIEPDESKFKVVRPGVSPSFFYFAKQKLRLSEVKPELDELIYGQESTQAQGIIIDRYKPILLACNDLNSHTDMNAPLRWAASQPQLLATCNILLISSPLESEEPQELLLSQFISLLGPGVRWLKVKLKDNLLAELYRVVADGQGAFVQPSLFEGYPLEVTKAMACGLPCFASIYGGGRDILEHGISGFLIDPLQNEECANTITQFFDICSTDEELWKNISMQASKYVKKKYVWKKCIYDLQNIMHASIFDSNILYANRNYFDEYLNIFYEFCRTI